VTMRDKFTAQTAFSCTFEDLPRRPQSLIYQCFTV
jgi:hypothetical protein